MPDFQRHMRHSSFFLLRSSLFILLSLAACDSSDPDDGMRGPPALTGQWRGVVTSSDTVAVPVEMEIVQDGTVLTGSGSLESPTGMFAFEIDPGSGYFHPTVNMFLLYGNAIPPLGTLNGIVSEDREMIRGTMDGPGFSGLAEFEMVKVE